MNDLARQRLAEIIARHGRSLVDNAQRCEALLRDYCGQHKREINVLIGALKERVPADLEASSAALPVEFSLARLARRLQDNLGFSEEASRWAVESWALALKVTTPATITTTRQAADEDDPFAHDKLTGSASAQPEEVLRRALRMVLADGVATEYERADLRHTRQQLGIPVEAASRIFAEVKAERQQSNNAARTVASPSKTIVVAQERGAQFQSISRAIETAGPGAHIVVRPGLYRESLLIDKPITITGDGPAEEITVESIDAPCLTARAARAEVRGISLRSIASGSHKDYFAVDVSYGELVLDGCDVMTDAGAAISIRGPETNPTIKGCRVHNGGNYGIWVWDEGGAIIEDCEISDCRGAGIIISGDTMEEARQMAASMLADISKDQSLIDRELSIAPSNNMRGARAKNVPTIRGCRIFGGQDHGLWVHYKGRCLVEESRIFENRAAGVWIDEGSEAALARSRVDHNRLEAIRVTGDSSASVEDCDLRENGKGAWAIEQGSKVRRVRNKE